MKRSLLPSDAPVFEFEGELYEGRPYALGRDRLGVETFDETRITLVDNAEWPVHWFFGDQLCGARARTKAARQLVEHARVALDEHIDAEIEAHENAEDRRAINDMIAEHEANEPSPVVTIEELPTLARLFPDKFSELEPVTIELSEVLGAEAPKAVGDDPDRFVAGMVAQFGKVNT